MRPPEIIETARLRLRPPTLEDAGVIFTQYAQDPEVTRYLTWRPHENIEVTRAFLRRCVQCWQEGSAFPWVMTRKNDGALLGMIELRIEGFRADIGYGIARPYWGQGCTSEAVKGIIEWALAQASIYRIWAVCDVDNPASARVMEKAGMQKEGILRRYIIHPNLSSEPRDCFCYSVVK
jgi:[ribosomal protein S5]-alanine N-acetyltransferase